MLEALALARCGGRYGRLLKTLGRVQLLILDDWGLATLSGEHAATCWRLWMIATNAVRPSFPAKCRSSIVTR